MSETLQTSVIENPIICPENLVYAKPTLMNEQTMHYCPGC